MDIKKEIADFCETCGSHECCPEEDCILYRIEQSLESDDFEKVVNKLSENKKACILILQDKKAETPFVGVVGEPTEIIWDLALATSRIIGGVGKFKQGRKKLFKEYKRITERMIDEYED